MRKPKAKPLDSWNELTRLIAAYTNAAIGDSWKGGGDPADVQIMELRLTLARAELNAHIIKMKRDLE